MSQRLSVLVLRGGSWTVKPEWVRSAFRLKDFPGDADSNLGFRLAKTLHYVMRGGVWYGGAGWCRSAYRHAYEPGSRHRDFSTRLAKTTQGTQHER